MILFPDTALEAAQQCVERVLEQTRTLRERDASLPVTITVSAGLAMASEVQEETLSQLSLTAIADARLFRAKDLGRNRMIWSD